MSKQKLDQLDRAIARRLTDNPWQAWQDRKVIRRRAQRHAYWVKRDRAARSSSAP